MENKNTITQTHWEICTACLGKGRKTRKLRKKTKQNYLRAIEEFEKSNKKGAAPIAPKGDIYLCSNCKGSGLVPCSKPKTPDTQNLPKLAIIGGGIGGIALGIACLHRGIPFTLYERDDDFEARSQGYGLTLQQANKSINELGIPHLTSGIVSTKHIVHNTHGEIIGEWGARKWGVTKKGKRTNIHIARQSLRLELINQLGNENIKWGHQLTDFKETEKGALLTFKTNEKIVKVKTDLVVGADGIRSTVRKLSIGEKATPLRYLGCIVILGICPLSKLELSNHELLDGKTVFQTANGKERIYMMPYDDKSIMWQLSFPISETKAKQISDIGRKALKEEAIKRTPWHNPIPEILLATPEDLISGYPVYDREILKPEILSKGKYTTLIGDAAHPMSPFKGQGANQALIDALTLAREITKNCSYKTEWKKLGIRKSVLNTFETEMLTRSGIKVKGSAEAAKNLHSDNVLKKGNQTRGIKINNDKP